MNIGLRLHDTRPGTLEERLDAAREQGFTCIQLAMSKSVPGFRMGDAPSLLTADLADEIGTAMAQREIGCAVLGCYLKLADKDAESRAHTQEIYRAHLRFARMLGAGVVGTETPAADSLGWSWEQCHSEEAFQLFLEGLRPVAHMAEEEDALLAVEPVCSHIIHTPERAERMLEVLKSDHVVIILDAVNLISTARIDQADAIVEEAIRRLGDRIRVLHMKDYLPAPEKDRPTPLACGLGQMRYGGLLALAKARNLPMTLENTTPDNAMQTRLYLEKLAAQIQG